MKNCYLISFDIRDSIPGNYGRAYKILEALDYTRDLKSSHAKALALPSGTMVKMTSCNLDLKTEIDEVKRTLLKNGIALGEHYIARIDRLRCSKES